jgi:hypothetical protein
MAATKTPVSFICPECNQAVETMVDAPAVEWGGAESASDVFAEDQTEVTCNHCKTEFPVRVQTVAYGCEVTLDDYPNTEVEAGYPFDTEPDDDWYDRDVPASPYEHFTDAYHHLGHLLAQITGEARKIYVPPSSLELFNRMVFTQGIAALEAYLGDTLKNGVLGSAHSTRAMLVGDNELKAMSISLADIAANPKIVQDTVAKHLSGLIYHNLAKVNKLYKIAFGINIWPSKGASDKMYVAVEWRHHCVHRNGKDKDGNLLTGITREYVDDILDTARDMVIHIEGGLGRDRSRDWLPSRGSQPFPRESQR